MKTSATQGDTAEGWMRWNARHLSGQVLQEGQRRARDRQHQGGTEGPDTCVAVGGCVGSQNSKRGVDIAGFGRKEALAGLVRFAKGPFCGYQDGAWSKRRCLSPLNLEDDVAKIIGQKLIWK